MRADSCAVRRCPNPVAYVLLGEAELEDGSRFACDRLYLCDHHRNIAKQADPTLPIRDIEDVSACA